MPAQLKAKEINCIVCAVKLLPTIKAKCIMVINYKTGLVLALLLAVFNLSAREVQVLTVEDFIRQVRQYHPVALQANLIVEKAEASLLSAKGGFDPVFDMDVNNKTLDGTNYYNYNNAEIKVPTLIGVDVKAGYENSNGVYKNPELTNGVASYLGIEISLLNGLLTDKKRAGLQQAKIYMNQGSQERLSMINDLLFEAYMTYWQWAASYQLFKTYTNYVTIATNRARLVEITFRNGDRSMADTIEAFTQLQNFQLMQQDALVKYKNKTLDLSKYLWTEETNPYILPGWYIPDTSHFERLLPLKNLDLLTGQLAQTHPELRTYEYKLEILEVERRLKFQSLLPSVTLKANLLSKDYFDYKGLDAAFLENNYKLGLGIQMPILVRKGRGDYKMTKIKLRETSLQQSDKLWQLQNKMGQYYNEAVIRQEQIQVALSMFKNYMALLKFEELRFSQGESSLFFINSRENKTLEIQQKLIELRLKYLEAVYAIDWTGGLNR
ncbi:MAG: TolC family protein [Bacteroidota bacterium]